jgi:tetratricopeptide (TPR) repeat protein
MLAIKNSAGKNLAIVLFFAGLLAGCTPRGPRALLDGKKLIEQGRYAEAVEKLKLSTSLIGTNAAAWNYLGLAYHNTKQVTNAALAYQRALALDHDLMEAHYNLGCLWLEQGRPDMAKTELTAFTMARADSPDGWLKLATAQSRLKDPVGAENSFKEALRLNQQNVEAMNGMGVVQLQRNRARDAEQWFDKALKQQPGYPPALLNRAIVLHNYLNSRPQALEAYRDYLALPARSANWEEVNGVARALEQELNVETARRTAASTPPPAPVANTNAPKTTASVAPRPTAATRPEVPNNSAPKTSPANSAAPANVEVVRLPPEQVVKPAQDISVASNPANARADLSAASAPSSPAVESPKAEKQGVLQHINPMKLFRHDTQTVARATPLPADSASPADFKPAADSARISETVTPSATPGRIVRYNYRNPPKPEPGNRDAAERLFAQGAQAQGSNHLPEAIQAYRQATQQDPAYYEAHYNLALAATAVGNLQQALAAYEMALAIRPESLDARYNFALVLKQAGCLVDSANELEKLLMVYPNEGRAHLALGNLYAQQLNQNVKAREHYLKVLEVDPRNPQAPAVRDWLTVNHP